MSMEKALDSGSAFVLSHEYGINTQPVYPLGFQIPEVLFSSSTAMSLLYWE
jgi:hypothetical protein